MLKEKLMEDLKEAMKEKEVLKKNEKSGREDLINQVKEEIEIINKYLPEQMEKEEIEKIVKEIVEETGATTIKDMGKVMRIAKERIGTRADGKDISDAVKKILA